MKRSRPSGTLPTQWNPKARSRTHRCCCSSCSKSLRLLALFLPPSQLQHVVVDIAPDSAHALFMGLPPPNPSSGCAALRAINGHHVPPALPSERALCHFSPLSSPSLAAGCLPGPAHRNIALSSTQYRAVFLPQTDNCLSLAAYLTQSRVVVFIAQNNHQPSRTFHHRLCLRFCLVSFKFLLE